MHRFRGRAFADVGKRCYGDGVCFVGEQWANCSQLTIVHSQHWPRRHELVSVQRVVDVVALHSIDNHTTFTYSRHKICKLCPILPRITCTVLCKLCEPFWSIIYLLFDTQEQKSWITSNSPYYNYSPLVQKSKNDQHQLNWDSSSNRDLHDAVWQQRFFPLNDYCTRTDRTTANIHWRTAGNYTATHIHAGNVFISAELSKTTCRTEHVKQVAEIPLTTSANANQRYLRDEWQKLGIYGKVKQIKAMLCKGVIRTSAKINKKAQLTQRKRATAVHVWRPTANKCEIRKNLF